jgi:hypothetical protein
VKTFHNGKYTDEIWAIYYVWGRGWESKKCCMTVIEKLAGLECEWLPKATRYMYQVAEKFLDEWEWGNCTLHGDGTWKHGYHHATFDVTH